MKSETCINPRFVIGLFITSLLILVGIGLAIWTPGLAAGSIEQNPMVSWNPGRLEVSIIRGTMIGFSIEFIATKELQNVSLFIVPEISDLFSTEFLELDSVVSNEEYRIPVFIEASSSTPLGVYEGTVHLRQRNRTVANTLKVVINVIAPSFSTIPTKVALPSTDRVTTDNEGHKLVKDEIVVGLDFNTVNPEERIIDIASSTGAKILGSIEETLTYQLHYEVLDLDALESKRILLESLPGIVFASHHYLMDAPLAAIPNDTEYDDTWDEDNPSGNKWNLEYIKALSAWDINTGSRDITVAVIDGDIDGNHGDLINNVVSSTGIRDSSFENHGTQVSGIICAEGNNNRGVAGISWVCSLRLYSIERDPTLELMSPVEAQEVMVNAVQEGARIVNMSLQWIDVNECIPGTDATLQRVAEHNAIFARAILFAERENRDVLWVFGAGNECRDTQFSSPASLTRNFPLNTITVASIGRGGNLSNFSDFGDLVTVAAPGEEIWTTRSRTCFLWIFCTDNYGLFGGTSASTPHVSGLAALVWSEHPDFSATQIKSCILSAAQSDGADISGHDFKVINAPEAVKCEGTVDLPEKVDIVISIDLTGSMLEEIDRVKAEIGEIITNLETVVSPSTDFRFGVVTYEDYAGFFDSTLCGSSYSAEYGVEGTKPGGDAPFRIEQPLTDDADTVQSRVTGLVNGFGADGPQSYARVFWELGQGDTGTSLGFRADALKLVINFSDNVPHDKDLNKGFVVPPIPNFDTGVDPGRNATIDCNGDDIDFQDDAIPALVNSDIQLLQIDSSGFQSFYPYWQFWVSEAGGAFAAINSDGSIPGGLNLTELIVDLLRLIP